MDLNRVYVADLESDGLLNEATKIWVLGVGYKDKQGVWQKKVTNDYNNIKKVFENENNVIVMHNGILFDKKLVEKILGIKVKAFIIDTLPLSWALFTNRLKYGLESFGEDYGIKKPEISDWENLTYEEYAHRVSEDVAINIALWEDLLSYLREIYDADDTRIIFYIKFLMSIMDVVSEQETLGIKLDKELAEANLQELKEMGQEIETTLKKLLPPIPIKVSKMKPKNLYKKDGSLSKAGEEWKTITDKLGLDFEYNGPIEIIKGYQEPNPNSVDQIKSYLFSKGWAPEIFSESISKTGEVKAVPQIKDKEKNLCRSVLAVVEKTPEFKVYEDLSIINHRKAYLESFLKNVRDDGYIEARIGGLTNTLRLKHRNLVNLIKVSAPFGKYVRPTLTCEDDEVFVGSDISSLENYTRTHFIADIEPEALKILEDPTYDSHIALGVFADLLTQEEADFFLWYKNTNRSDLSSLSERFKTMSEVDMKSEIERITEIRQKSKTTSYSALYGIGKVKLAKELKISQKEAQQLLDGYWKLNNSVKVFSSQCKIKTVRNQMWVLNPLNNLYYSLRKEADIFSTINQGAGSFIHVLWMANMRKRGIKIIGNFHDEILTVCKSEDKEKVEQIIRESMELVNKQLNMKVTLKVDVQFGKNYGDVH